MSSASYDTCDPDSVTQIVVSGAGAADWDGVYIRSGACARPVLHCWPALTSLNWLDPMGHDSLHAVIVAANVGDGAAFQKDPTHEIYSSGGVWRLADYGVATFYVATGDGRAGNAMPPTSGFTVTGGAEPPPRLDLGQSC